MKFTEVDYAAATLLGVGTGVVLGVILCAYLYMHL